MNQVPHYVVIYFVPDHQGCVCSRETAPYEEPGDGCIRDLPCPAETQGALPCDSAKEPADGPALAFPETSAHS